MDTKPIRTPREMMEAGCTDADEWSANLRKAAAAAGGIDNLDLYVWFNRAMRAREYGSPASAPNSTMPPKATDGGAIRGATSPSPVERTADSVKRFGSLREALEGNLRNMELDLQRSAKENFIQRYLVAKRSGGNGVGPEDAEFAHRLYEQIKAIVERTVPKAA